MTLPNLAAALALVIAAPSPAAAAPEEGRECLLDHPGADAATAQACVECHGDNGHPVETAYAAAAARKRGKLRDEQEVVRRGVLLVDGRIQCVTCHDGRSPFAAKIALPAGSPEMQRDADAWGFQPRTDGFDAGAPGAFRRMRGSPVDPTALCNACHTTAD